MAMDRRNTSQETSSPRSMMERFFHLFQDPRDGQGLLPIDMAEDEHNYTIHASLPGFKPEEIQIQVMDNRLLIQAEHEEEQQQSQQSQSYQWLIRERHTSAYRIVTLPSQVDADQAQAQFEHGLLTLTLPRAPSAQPKQIHIGSGETQQTMQESASDTQQAQTASSPQDQPADTSATSDRIADDEKAPDPLYEADEGSFPASDPSSTSPVSP